MIATTHTSGGAAGSARCAFCRTLFEQAGVRRLHVDLGAVPSEAATSDDGSETVNGDDDENRVLARDAERLAVGVANAIFAKDEAKITRTATESQRWIATQRRTKPTAGVSDDFFWECVVGRRLTYLGFDCAVGGSFRC